MPSNSDPTDPLRSHLRSERHAGDRHPLPEQIVAYHERRLSLEEADEVRAHLAGCPDCTTQLLELAALFDPEDDPGAEISRAELDAAWQRQRARLFPDASTALSARRTTGSPLRRAWATVAFLGLAASLLAVVALVQWQTIARLRQPQVNPPLVNLAPVGSVRQGAGPVQELRLSGDTPRGWVILNPMAELNAPSYDVEVVAPDGRVVLRLEDRQSSEKANFRLEIPGSVLREGDYRILLIGKNAGRREVVEEFELRVRSTPQPSP